MSRFWAGDAEGVASDLGRVHRVHRAASFSHPQRFRSASAAKKTGASALLDSLLQPVHPDSRNPFKGFGLVAAYRRPSILLDDCPDEPPPPPLPPPPGPPGPPGPMPDAVESEPVPLTKSASAPAVCFTERVLRGDFGDFGDIDLDDCTQPKDQTSTAERAWKCRGCGNTDHRLLSKTDDCSFACDRCGTVDGGPDLWHSDRQKNCPRDEDKTIVAEEVKKGAAQLAHEAIACGGAEGAQDRRKRHLQTSGGTRISKMTRHKYALTAAQARVDTQVVRESRARIDGDPQFVRKRDRVLRDTEAVFDQLKPFDDRLQRHIRMETVRVLTNGFEHAKACTGACCQIALNSRANSLLAICSVQKCLERLVCNDALAASIAPECSKHALLKSLDCVSQLQLQGGAGATQRAQVAAVVGLVMNWLPEEITLACANATPTGGDTAAGGEGTTSLLAPSPPSAQASAPSPLLLPPPSHQSASVVGQSHSPWSPTPLAVEDDDDHLPRSDHHHHHSACDPIWNVVRSIHGAWRLANVRADVKQAATAAVQEPALAEWIRNENTLPMCVLGVAVLKAAAAKLGLEDGTNELLEQYCFTYFISPTTARQAAEQLTGIMTIGKATTMGVFGDGIF